VKRALLLLLVACGGADEVCQLDGMFCDKLSSYDLAGAIPYDVNTPLFSDYTTKERAILLPAGGAMTWSDTGAFELPVGSALIKTFSYPTQKLETRLLVRTATGWTGASYVHEGDDAKLAVAGAQIAVEWGRYSVPNKNQCKNCHAEHDDAIDLIGLKARHVNKGEQLQRFIDTGILVGAPSPETWPRAPAAMDPQSGSLDARARAWLDINCAYCHNSNGGAARTSGLYLELGQIDPGFCKPPVAAGRGSGGRAYAIVPGNPDASFLLYRLESTEPEVKMPELGRNLVDAEGVALIREWIAAMPGTCATPLPP
jgi:uncharacterized repeat protein (TIGR03806 family)